jgi:hypothetical protein
MALPAIFVGLCGLIGIKIGPSSANVFHDVKPGASWALQHIFAQCDAVGRAVALVLN